jgi:hypothetical protein
MNLIDRIVTWVKNLIRPNAKPTELIGFRETNKPWIEEKMVYEGILDNTKNFGVKHYLICRRLTTKESKIYWKEGNSIPTHWVKFIYFTKQGTRMALIDEVFSFVKKGFKPDDVAIYVIRETAKQIIILDKTSMIFSDEDAPKIPTRKVFLSDQDGYASKLWQKIILDKFNDCQSSLGK